MAYRRLFLDSRFRNSGTHADFSIELPDDVMTSRTSSVYVASCSFANAFKAIMSSNQLLYVTYTANLTKTTTQSVSNGTVTILTKETALVDDSVVVAQTKTMVQTVKNPVSGWPFAPS